ncbi:hypothetical protein, conserved [Eimeria necatrix]|uniref:50S ribosomal protein L18 n=1 Tax=Eimeria necatrix TaxID=51315 RepID=U6MS77_9EIME|nr:hypothetical protein, conserved [Eimeria necatrix]CDJ65953.1 hypothetical protein, conserved [Eimeria necatrix]
MSETPAEQQPPAAEAAAAAATPAAAAGPAAAAAAAAAAASSSSSRRLRLTATLSNNHIYACITDPSGQQTFAFASSMDKELAGTLKQVKRKRGKFAAAAAAAAAAAVAAAAEGAACAVAGLVARQHGGTLEAAAAVGALVAARGLRAGVSKVYFDRKQYKYAGRIAALADGARKAGLDF